MTNSIWGVLRRLLRAASVYSIWQERNFRLFKGEVRPDDVVVNSVIESVRLKLSTLQVRNSLAVQNVAK